MQRRIVFLTLKVFSATGGIEKVSRIAGKALAELCEEQGYSFTMHAMYDHPFQLLEKYIPARSFRGFGNKKAAFVLQSIRQGRGAALVILSHINLLSVGYAIKQLSPRTRVVLIAHGIEVWETLPAWKMAALRSLDLVLPVSGFTRAKMRELYNLPEEKLQVVNNCLDPFLPKPVWGEKSATLLQKYGIAGEGKVLMTLTRLSERDSYKGYDDVLMALKSLKRDFPGLRYLLVGGYERVEKERLDRLITQQGLEADVVFTGYIEDESLAEHFSLADIYIMPSRKEGFGIVFIEALYYGVPVIAGNVDGSVDALAGGSLGQLVDPDDNRAIRRSIRKYLEKGIGAAPATSTVLARFGFGVYKEALWKALKPLLEENQPTIRTGLTAV